MRSLNCFWFIPSFRREAYEEIGGQDSNSSGCGDHPCYDSDLSLFRATLDITCLHPDSRSDEHRLVLYPRATMEEQMNEFTRFDATATIKLNIWLIKSDDCKRVQGILENQIADLLDGKRGIKLTELEVKVSGETTERTWYREDE